MTKTISEDQITYDYFYKKKVTVWQLKNGYRFSIDAPILADFLPFSPGKKALEIGTGCGIISLLALYKNKFSSVTAIEIQKPLFQLAVINSEKNSLSHKFFPLLGDFNRLYKRFSGIEIIFSNPPYIKIDQGRLSLNKNKTVAKTEIGLNLKSLLEKSHDILAQKGDLYLILPVTRQAELEQLSKNVGFHVSRIREIHSFSYGKPERFLVQLSNYTVPIKRMNPLIIFREKQIYTQETKKILSG